MRTVARYTCPVHGSLPMKQGATRCMMPVGQTQQCDERLQRLPDPIVTVFPNGEIHTGTRGSGLSEIDVGTLVQAWCALPGGALGKKKNKRHEKMVRAPLALRVIEAITAAGFKPGEIVVIYGPGDTIVVGAFAEKGWT